MTPSTMIHDIHVNERSLRDKEKFLPIRKDELIERFCQEGNLSTDDVQHFKELGHIVSAMLHFEHHLLLDRLKAAYDPFDPDTDKSPLTSGECRQSNQDELFSMIDSLLEKGNFFRLSRKDLEAAMKGCSAWGLNIDVDFDIFDHLAVYARGDFTGFRYRRSLKNWYRREEVELPIYQRLVVVFRLKPDRRLRRYVNTESIYMKIFKDIPQMDVEMLLPASKIKMTNLDRTKIILPTLSGLSITAWKIVKGAVIVAAAKVYGTLALLGLVGGTIGYGVRSFYGYLNTKKKYQLDLTESLYYQNLDNNLGVLYRLIGEAEEQEVLESLLAYYALWRHAGADGWTAGEVDCWAEGFIARNFHRHVNFDVSDALAKLSNLSVVDDTGDGRFRALPISDALTQLDHSWDGFFQPGLSPSAGYARKC